MVLSSLVGNRAPWRGLRSQLSPIANSMEKQCIQMRHTANGVEIQQPRLGTCEAEEATETPKGLITERRFITIDLDKAGKTRLMQPCSHGAENFVCRLKNKARRVTLRRGALGSYPGEQKRRQLSQTFPILCRCPGMEFNRREGGPRDQRILRPLLKR
jgi:hypothetical protein